MNDLRTQLTQLSQAARAAWKAITLAEYRKNPQVMSQLQGIEGSADWLVSQLDDPELTTRLHLDAVPTIVCLCGSTRFWRTFQQAGLQETMAGRIVLSIGAASGTDDEHFGNLPREEYDAVKTMLDELHLAKVALADEVLILNVDGYIGESTRRELDHAIALGKRVRYWDPVEEAAA